MTHLVPISDNANHNGFQAIIPGISQQLSISGSSQQSAAFSATPNLVRLFATKDCYIEIGTNPTATSSSMFLPGGIVEYFGLFSGYKLAVLQASSSGTLYVTEGK